MTILTIRLPRDLARALPRRQRVAWVIDAIWQRLRDDRIQAIAQSATDHVDEELNVESEWNGADRPMKPRASHAQ